MLFLLPQFPEWRHGSRNHHAPRHLNRGGSTLLNKVGSFRSVSVLLNRGGVTHLNRGGGNPPHEPLPLGSLGCHEALGSHEAQGSPEAQGSLEAQEA